MPYQSILSNPNPQAAPGVPNAVPVPSGAGTRYRSIIPPISANHIQAVGQSFADEQAQLADQLVKRNTTGNFLKNMKIAGGKAVAHSLATGARETLQTIPRMGGELGASLTGQTTPSTGITAFLQGKAPSTPLQVQGAETAAAHPKGFHIKGTPITLSPTQTGLALAGLKGAADVTSLTGPIGGEISDTAKTITAAKGTAKNVATQNLLKTAERANAPAKPSPVNQIVNKAEFAKTTVPPATRLLSAPAKKPVEGPGFTMSERTSPTALAASKRVNEINKTLSDVSSGKTASTGAELRGLIQEKQKLGEAVHNEAPIPDVPVSTTKPVEAPSVVPKPSSTPVKTQAVAGVESTATGAKTVEPAKTVRVPEQQVPVGTGKTQVSTLENRMQNTLHSIPEEDRAKISTYNTMNKQENISAAAKFVDSNPEDAMKVLTGEKHAPAGIAHNSIFLALDAKSAGDPQLALKLASLKSTRYGQEISLLSEANPYSPTKHIAEIQNLRIQRAGGQKALNREVAGIKQTIRRTATSSTTRQDWNSFVESLRC